MTQRSMEPFERFKEALTKGDAAGVRERVRREFVDRCLDMTRLLGPIHVAAENGYTEIARILIENGCNIHCSNTDGSRPIHAACGRGHKGIVNLLIEKKCDIECSNKDNGRPIHAACRYGHRDIVELLIENGCDIECETINNLRPIHIACKCGYIDIVEILMKKGCDIECEEEIKRRPIHYACINGNFDIVKLLIEKGCDIDCKDEQNKSPLDLARKNNKEVCAKIVEKISNMIASVKSDDPSRFRDMYESVVASDDENNISLSFADIAVTYNARGIIQYLLERTIDDKELMYLTNVIDRIQQFQSTEMTKELVLYRSIRDRHVDGFHKFFSFSVMYGQHHLMAGKCEEHKTNLATLYLEPILCQSLMKENGLINEVNKEGNNCLQELLMEIDQSKSNDNIDRIFETVETLIKCGVDLSPRTQTGLNVLQLASNLNSEKLMLVILNEGGSRNVIGNENIDDAFKNKWFEYGQRLLKCVPKDRLKDYIQREYIETNLKSADPKLIKYLFANASLNVQQKVLEKVLFDTAYRDDEKMFEFFVETEVYLAERNAEGETLLTDLLKKRKIKYSKKLIESKNFEAYANMRNNNQQTPLQVAIEMEEIGIVCHLIRVTKEINNKDKNGETALTQLLKDISICDNDEMGRILFELIKSVIDRGGDIYMKIDETRQVIDCCSNISFRKQVVLHFQLLKKALHKT